MTPALQKNIVCQIVITLFSLGFVQAQSGMLPISFSDTSSSVILKEITISQLKSQSFTLINQLDQELKPVNSSQDLLKLVPGLFIAQHAGGGKAEQIFLRGFDCDHGTDFAISIDGMPVNMPSHAHGQGYSDFHFVIPETVDALKVFKGPYSARFGDFATSGAGEFSTKNAIEKSTVKFEYGMFDTYRALAMIDLLGNKHLFSKQKESMYVAGEYVFTNSYFKSLQDFKRLNVFGKYTGRLNDRTSLTFSASSFSSSWDASGQVPERAIKEGIIDRFGSIDNSEGGSTSRSNANLLIASSLLNGGVIKNQIYYSHYRFDLFSNFTFFLNDSINGDQIDQTEKGRNIYGYNSTFEKYGTITNKDIKTVIGIGTRMDDGDISLRHSVKRQILDTIVAGHLFEQNLNAFADETIDLTEKLSVNAGVRFDYFVFNFNNYQFDSLSGQYAKQRVSPKLNFYYNLNSSVQFYIHSGIGFHSNDARSVVSGQVGNSLPRAYGYEAGSTFKPGKKMVINAALWGLDLENELVYVGDEGVTEISGATRRLGADLAMRLELSKIIFADLDLNYNYGRYKDLPKGENYIPLAPSFTSIGGLTIKRESGLSGSIRYRYIDSRPANEDNSVTAKGYFLLDAVVNYQINKIQFGVTAQNLLNSEWNEAQFDTESRLKSEVQPVSELHFTPGTPFFVKFNVLVMF